LERPLFGQSVRRVLGLRSDLLKECLDHQREVGGRLGEILRSRGLITREQIFEILGYQARWIASATQVDLSPHSYPYPAFLSLCMPAYNEQCNIQDTLDAACAILPAFVQRFEIIVVNDGSKDETGAIVGRYAEQDPRVRLVTHEHNCGYGAAVSSGLRAAEGDLIAFTDSDGQFSLLDLPQLLTRLKGSDVVVGYRYRRADNWVRRMNAGAWNWLIRTMLNVQIQDLDCAFKLFRREVVDNLSLTAQGAGINAEIMAQCARHGRTVREMPVTHYPRYYGAPTGAALKVILKAFRELPRLWKYRYAAAPLVNNSVASATEDSSGDASVISNPSVLQESPAK
jgi:glycosyltransferase involved in cell wall biosynthesis